MHHFMGQMVTKYNPTFKLFDIGVLNGVDNLNPSLTINSVTVTPTFRYKGGDANASGWNAWTYGPNLSLITVTNTPTYNAGSPLIGINDDAVFFNQANSHAFRGTDSTIGDITDQDFVCELVINSGVGQNSAVSKRTTGNRGIQFSTGSAGNGGWAITDTSTGTNVNITHASGTYVDNTWYHNISFFDRSETVSCIPRQS